jgi:competence protein ComEC
MLFAAPSVPTTRAWFMGGLGLLAVLLDRAPVSMRLVAWAALAVLATTPEAVLGPSFQMSFAAVVALVAA